MRILLIINSLISLCSNGQSCPDDTLFNRFKRDIHFELTRYGQLEWDDETRESYYTLMSNCPIESLVKYVEDSIPAVRSLIFGGMAQKNADINLLTEILSKHKNDTAEYINSSTDVAITWTVRDFMQTTLRWKADNKIPNEGVDYESRLKTIRDRFRIIIPGVYHGMVSKDSLLVIDSLTCSMKGYRIISFSLTSETKSVITNNIFTKEIKQFIRDLRSGEIFTIDDIVVEDSGKSRSRVASVLLEVK